MAANKLNPLQVGLRNRAKAASQVAVNAAFMWEIKSVNQELWRLTELLHDLCKRPHMILRRGRRLLDYLEQLQDLVAMQFALEEAYGYFDDPQHVEAALSQRAVALRDEHADLYRSLIHIVDLAGEYYFSHNEHGLLFRIPTLFDSFMQQFRAHDERECELTLVAMNDVIGVGD